MSRRRAVIGIIAAVLVLGTVWWMRRPPDGFLTGIAPIDGSRSVFTMRANYSNGPSRAWIGVVDAELDRVLWSRELPGETYSIHARHGTRRRFPSTPRMASCGSSRWTGIA